ncbi:CdaR family transcriptional regulator [Paenibacillus senegalensis]|uniref:CdaR family transcriptional regulator n=1 Tax=Paenibacillus senegalensis TaxID=1465766 RepID=UPI0002880C12|nr:sugar diacid recognition domain-containing protein [Paenibacillus senegalensis]
MLTVKLAEAIVAETMKRVQWNINMMDPTGKIIASGDSMRVGQQHPGAIKAVRTGKPVYISADEAISMPEAEAGINWPITYGGEVVGVIGITGTPAHIEPVSQLLVMTAEMMIQQAQTVVQEEWRQTITDLLLRELMHETPRMEWIRQHAQSLQFPLTPPFQIALLQTKLNAPSAELPSHDYVLRLLADGRSSRPHILLAKLQPERYLLVFSGVTELSIRDYVEHLVKRASEYSPSVGISSPVRQVKDIRTALTEAELALDIAHPGSLFLPGKEASEADSSEAIAVKQRQQERTAGGAITFYEEIEGQALMQLIPSVHRERLRERLSPHWTPRLQETLEAYFACNLNMAQAAQLLGIHRNTMIYRLQQCRDRTGYNPEVFHDALLLQCMIWMEKRKQ